MRKRGTASVRETRANEKVRVAGRVGALLKGCPLGLRRGQAHHK